MHNYRRFALATTAATYFLIFVGGLVRVAGAGLGCPDWPKCFGRWIPPLSISQLPPDIDPATFNVTLAWIEWTNRLAGMTVGFMILAVAILALRHYRRSPGVLWPSLAAAVLVAYQGWQGSVVVSSELQPFIVTVHMVLALVIVSLLLYAVLRSYAVDDSAPAINETTRRPRILAGVLWLITIGQIILGSQVRQAVETAKAAFPLGNEDQWLAAVGVLEDVHLFLGMAVLALTLYVGPIVLRMTPKCSPLAAITVRAMMVVVITQITIGVVLLIFDLPPLADLFHLWMAALFVGLTMVLYVELPRTATGLDKRAAGYKRFVIIGVIVLAIMGGVAYTVIEQARQSVGDSSTISYIHRSDVTRA